MAGRRTTQLALLLLLSSSCAWANDGTRKPERSDLRLGREDFLVGQAGSLVTVRSELDETRFDDSNEGIQQPRHQGYTSEKRVPTQQDGEVDELQQLQARTPTAEEAAQITTPPSLNLPILQRQNNNQGQIDDLNSRLQSAQQSAQQALQSLSDASRRVSQASQQLSQSSQQLSQQSQQLSQQSQQLSASLQQATQSVQSLTQAVSSALSSGSSAFASCTSSASVALAQASGELASKVGEAQAQITLANNQAQNQVQQAQGAAVSITQAALAIVGTFIGSSLLTVLIVWLIVRHKRKQKDRAAAPMNTGVSSYYGGGPGAEAYGSIAKDVKEMMLSPASGTTKIGSEAARSMGGSRGNDMVTRGYGREKEDGIGTAMSEAGGGGGGGDVQIGYARSTNYRERKTPKLSEPPSARKKDSPVGGGMATPRTPKYEVFPRVTKNPSAPAPGMQGGANRRPRSSIQPDYNLQEWLSTTTVSPFGTLERASNVNANANTNTNTTMSTAAAVTAPAARPEFAGRPQGAAAAAAAAAAAERPQPQPQQQPKRTSEVKWPLQGSSSSEAPSRSNSNTSRDADADADADASSRPVTYQPGPAVARVPPAPRTISSSGPAATRSVRVGVESMRGIGLPGVARKLPLRNP